MGEAVWGGCQPQPWPNDIILTPQVTQNPNIWPKYCGDVNPAWRIILPIEFEDVADEENEQKFNPNQSKDEMSECENDSDCSSCAGGEYKYWNEKVLKELIYWSFNQTT